SKAEAPTEGGGVPRQSPVVAKTIPQPTPAPFVNQKQPESVAANPPPPPKQADALARKEVPSSPVTGGVNVSSANSAAPSYAPPPTTESVRVDERRREQQSLSVIHGPQRGETLDKNKSMDDRSRGTGDYTKARDEDRVRTGSDQPVAKEESKD